MDMPNFLIGYEYFNGMDMPNFLIGIEKLDDYKVRLSLKEPEAPFIANLAMDFASILSAEYVDVMMAAGTPEKVDLDPVGTGPFQLLGYQKDVVIRYKAISTISGARRRSTTWSSPSRRTHPSGSPS